MSQRDVLTAMNQCLTHRGPDDSGEFTDGPVGLAHRRLSIIDPSAGAQPVFNESGDIAVIFNGEIYNHQELRKHLTHHTFETETDTEVLVHLYEDHGTAFVEKLRGMFAFALWDRNLKRLVLARDRVGIKPLVFASDGNTIGFASEMSSLLAAAEQDAISLGTLDKSALTQYLAFGHIPAPRTAFSNVRCVLPGERIIVSADGVERDQYWKPSVTARNPTLNDAATELRMLVEQAVEKRLMSDVPLGAFLSGGLDSSIIVGTMASLRDDAISTFSVGFEENRFDERWAARKVAKRHNTNHHEYTVTPEDVRDVVPTVLDRLGEPFADPSLIPTYIVARETSNEVTVALSGDGADELFAGYDRYWGEHLSSYYRVIPSTVRRQLERLINTVPVDRTSNTGEFTRKVRKFARGGESDSARRHFEWARRPDQSAVKATEVDFVSEGVGVLQSQHSGLNAWLPPSRRDDLTRMQAVETRHGLPDQILHKSDLSGMFNSLEVRVPFLDTDILEFAFSLPRSYKLTARSRKRILREAFADLLPQEIERRNKQGFDMPIGEWLTGPMESDFIHEIQHLDDELLKSQATIELLEEHRKGRADHSGFLWTAFVYARWRNQMDDRDLI